MRARFGLWLAQPWRAASLLFGVAAIVAASSALSSLRPRAPVAVTRSASVNHKPGAARAAEISALDRARRAAVGKKIFFDRSLSQPAGTSCASCHDPARGYAGNNGSTVGVARGSRPDHLARRNTPSVLYLTQIHRFHYHWEEDASLPDAFGGFFWDGRADSLATLVEQPLTNPDEMNGGDRVRVAGVLRDAVYADELRSVFGATSLETPDGAMSALGQALEAFLTSDELSPYSSRYDDFIRGRGTLTSLELRGMQLFRDPSKGNCASCHRFNPTSDNPKRSPFSDYGYEVVGVPRNNSLNRSGNDLGLCERQDPRAHTDEDRFCGAFRTPSLRNVTTRDRWMHNGYFSRLRDVVAFYATRSTEPARWYPKGAKYDDLPAKYHQYVNELSPPYDRGVGEQPRLDEEEIDAIVAFLGTLTDAAYRNPVASTPLQVPSNPSSAVKHDHSQPQPRHDLRTLANQPQLQTQ